MSGKRKRKETSLGDTLLSRTGRAKGIRVIRAPEPTPEPETIITEQQEDIDYEYEEEFEEFEEEEAEEADEAEDFEADDFEDFIRTLDEETKEAERTIEVRTFSEYLRAGGDPKRLRKVRYYSQEEAEEFLVQSGIAGFAEILFDEESDLFGIAVYDSPGATTK